MSIDKARYVRDHWDTDDKCPIDKMRFSSTDCDHSTWEVGEYLQEQVMRAIARDEWERIAKQEKSGTG